MTCNEVDFKVYEDTEINTFEEEVHGWVVVIKTPTGDLFLNGGLMVENGEIGFYSADMAINGLKKWCRDRGFKVPHIFFDVHTVRDES